VLNPTPMIGEMQGAERQGGVDVKTRMAGWCTCAGRCAIASLPVTKHVLSAISAIPQPVLPHTTLAAATDAPRAHMLHTCNNRSPPRWRPHRDEGCDREDYQRVQRRPDGTVGYFDAFGGGGGGAHVEDEDDGFDDEMFGDDEALWCAGIGLDVWALAGRVLCGLTGACLVSADRRNYWHAASFALLVSKPFEPPLLSAPCLKGSPSDRKQGRSHAPRLPARCLRLPAGMQVAKRGEARAGGVQEILQRHELVCAGIRLWDGQGWRSGLISTGHRPSRAGAAAGQWPGAGEQPPSSGQAGRQLPSAGLEGLVLVRKEGKEGLLAGRVWFRVCPVQPLCELFCRLGNALSTPLNECTAPHPCISPAQVRWGQCAVYDPHVAPCIMLVCMRKHVQ
jgi:hypothetical protein